ncbi:MAG: hypothetical protein A2X58_07905 [Nitrospirae bacterium GWC2_56_14]|nr:MAG: hypothetical protein A2X58_07905 [Nitrospirae bacterium GWC2_56_14]
MIRRAIYLAVLLIGFSLAPGQVPVAVSQEAELVIAKYGSVMVKSSVLDAKVFIDDVASGSVNTVIENVSVGDHLVACRVEGKTVSGKFSVVKNETLRLEARFDEQQLIDITEAERAEAARKKKAEAAKLEEQKKALEAKKTEPKKANLKKPEPKKAEAKNPKEAFRDLHLNVIKIYPESEVPELHVTSKVNKQVITKYAETKDQSGKYYRTKQGMLLCEVGLCKKEWSATFVYTDEAGKSDSFLVRWREIIFNGITPTGTSKRELEVCLNGACQKREDNSASDTVHELTLDRYSLGWTRSLIAIRRADVMKELQESGGDVENY